MARIWLIYWSHHMKFETYKKVLDGPGMQEALQTAVDTCVQRQVDDSAFELISEEAGLFLSPLRPMTKTPVSTAIWYHLNPMKSSHHHDKTCRIQYHLDHHNRRYLSLHTRL
jgi:hypothetical protein